MQSVLEKINENIQIIYRKAIDADAALDKLQQLGKGKFTVIFSEGSDFITRSKRFRPYVDELAIDFSKLRTENDDVEKELVAIVKKIKLLLLTVGKLKVTL
jgi:CO dehydrogenase nickel-insertion accessory protein CooC1